MFNNFEIPTVAVVENMSHFVCPCCSASHDIFSKKRIDSSVADDPLSPGRSKLEEYRNINRLIEQFGIRIHARIPVDQDFATLRFVRTSATSPRRNGFFGTTNRDVSSLPEEEEEVFPFVRAFDERHPVWRVLKSLCEDVVRAVSSARFSTERAPSLKSLERGLLELVVTHPLAMNERLGERNWLLNRMKLRVVVLFIMFSEFD